MSEARFILSKKKVIEQYNSLKTKGFIVSYSTKTNTDVAKILEDRTDSMFSIHSNENIETIKNKKKVWFIAQAWSSEQISNLLNLGVDKFIVDNEEDLDVLLKTLKDKETKITLLLRMKLKEHSIFTGRYFVFGMNSNVVNRRISELKSNSNIQHIGIHVHRKTQNVGEWSLKRELEQSLSNETLESIDYVNLGGGLPAKYKNSRDDILPLIFQKLEETKNWLVQYNIQTILEPGRYIAAPSCILETQIIGIIDDDTLVINCSVYNSNMDTIVIPIKLLVQGELEHGKSYKIKGLTPDSMDIFRYSVKLKNPKIGDKIFFLNAGAYNYSTDFFNLKKLVTVVKEDF